jgi:hypothetical protein
MKRRGTAPRVSDDDGGGEAALSVRGGSVVIASPERLGLETVHSRPLTIGGRGHEYATRVHLRLASSHPSERLRHRLAAREDRL